MNLLSIEDIFSNLLEDSETAVRVVPPEAQDAHYAFHQKYIAPVSGNEGRAMDDALGNITYLHSKHGFIAGFKVAARLMVEALVSGEVAV